MSNSLKEQASSSDTIQANIKTTINNNCKPLDNYVKVNQIDMDFRIKYDLIDPQNLIQIM